MNRSVEITPRAASLVHGRISKDHSVSQFALSTGLSELLIESIVAGDRVILTPDQVRKLSGEITGFMNSLAKTVLITPAALYLLQSKIGKGKQFESQAALAKAVDVTKSTINQIVKGIQKKLKVKLSCKMCELIPGLLDALNSHVGNEGAPYEVILYLQNEVKRKLKQESNWEVPFIKLSDIVKIKPSQLEGFSRKETSLNTIQLACLFKTLNNGNFTDNDFSCHNELEMANYIVSNYKCKVLNFDQLSKSGYYSESDYYCAPDPSVDTCINYQGVIKFYRVLDIKGILTEERSNNDVMGKRKPSSNVESSKNEYIVIFKRPDEEGAFIRSGSYIKQGIGEVDYKNKKLRIEIDTIDPRVQNYLISLSCEYIDLSSVNDISQWVDALSTKKDLSFFELNPEVLSNDYMEMINFNLNGSDHADQCATSINCKRYLYRRGLLSKDAFTILFPYLVDHWSAVMKLRNDHFDEFRDEVSTLLQKEYLHLTNKWDEGAGIGVYNNFELSEGIKRVMDTSDNSSSPKSPKLKEIMSRLGRKFGDKFESVHEEAARQNINYNYPEGIRYFFRVIKGELVQFLELDLGIPDKILRRYR